MNLNQNNHHHFLRIASGQQLEICLSSASSMVSFDMKSQLDLYNLHLDLVLLEIPITNTQTNEILRKTSTRINHWNKGHKLKLKQNKSITYEIYKVFFPFCWPSRCIRKPSSTWLLLCTLDACTIFKNTIILLNMFVSVT